MKCVIMMFFVASVSGCSVGDWVGIAGEVMNATDHNEKNARSERIKAANKAAGY